MFGPRRSDYGRVLPAHRWQGISRARRFWRALRPWLGTALLIAVTGYWFGGPQRIVPTAVPTVLPSVMPSVMPGGAGEVIAGPFSRCGTGRAANCVIDGDTVVIGRRIIRVMGIDAPETHPARCPQEAQLGEAATLQLLALVNQGPFTLAGPVPPARDEYGRELRRLLRGRADGSVQVLADDMVASRSARAYLRGPRQPWC